MRPARGRDPVRKFTRPTTIPTKIESAMRLRPIPPSELTEERRVLYADMPAGIERGFKAFTAIDDSGALLGPWTPWLLPARPRKRRRLYRAIEGDALAKTSNSVTP